ncbi:MAG: serine/threonine protein kinase [Deltaproteobacteria bacterium]|nr:serine/threonine protein kinase [Deltaproteobacteria bacterium]
MARLIGHYEVVKELGAGAFGAVYLAVGEVPGRMRQPARRRLVAIKKLKNSADPESVQALIQEFALLDQVKHRCIVRVFDYLEDEHAVVMEHIHGATLRTVMDALAAKKEQFFTEAAIEIGCEIADALYQAYTMPGDNGEPLQLVHRDLKPANVMLTPQGEVKLLDWGLAKVDNADFRKDDADRIKGTLLYMAPEQARGDRVDHSADVFSLGLILFELLMGEALYQIPQGHRDPLKAVIQNIERGETAARCAELEQRLPGIGTAITRALRPRMQDRFKSGQEMMVDLRRGLFREPGADLREFCEFFFSTVHDLGEAPTLGSVALQGRTPARARLSIEERLRQSMARDSAAAGQIEEQILAGPRTGPVTGPPTRAGRAGGAPTPPMPAVPSAPPMAPPPARPSAPPLGAAPPPPPRPMGAPSGMGAMPPVPGLAGPPPPLGAPPRPPAPLAGPPPPPGAPPRSAAGGMPPVPGLPSGPPPPRPGPPRPPRPDPSTSPPAPTPEEPPGFGGADMSNTRGGPPRPPVGGAASRATPFAPPGGGPPKPEGPRPAAPPPPPKAGGVLQMVPLNNDDDEVSVKGDPSATAFFAIPAPKAERGGPGPAPAPGGFSPPPAGGFAPPPTPGAPPPPMPGAPNMPGMPQVGGPPMPPPMRPPMGQPSPAAMPGYGQPGMGIQGPMAGYGGAAGGAGGSPFQVGGAAPPPAPDASEGTQSHRVYAILTAVVLLVCVAAVAAVLLRGSGKPDEPAPAVAKVDAEPAPKEKKKKKKAEEDTAAPPPAAPTPKPKGSGGGGTPKPKPASGGAAPAPAPRANGGSVSVRLSGAPNTSFEVSCPGGFRGRGSLSGGAGSVSGVPGEDCTVYFKGGPPAKYGPVRGGQSISCTIEGNTAICR